MSYLYEKSLTGQTSASGTITLEGDQACWHNQLIVSCGTATAGTLTIKYKIGGKTFSMKDQYGTAITMSLVGASPDPIRFDGMIDAVVIEQTGVNGTFDLLLIGQATS